MNPQQNAIGQGTDASLLNLALLLVVIYVVKLVIVAQWRKKNVAVVLYTVVIALSLAYIYVLVEVDWRNTQVNPLWCWIGTSVALLFVPTASFALDVFSSARKGLLHLSVRTAIELFLLLPLWYLSCAWAAMYLGWAPGP